MARGPKPVVRAPTGGGALQGRRGAGGGPRCGARSLTCLALTWLNPHVYLDTVVLLGSVSTRYGEARPAFAFGAVTASFFFFFSLGYGARLLQPLFTRAGAWQVLDALVGVTMLVLGAALLRG